MTTRHLPPGCLRVADLPRYITVCCREQLLAQLARADALRRAYQVAGVCCAATAAENHERVEFLHRVALKVTTIQLHDRYDNSARHTTAILLDLLLTGMATEQLDVVASAWEALCGLYVAPHYAGAAGRRRAHRMRPDHLPPR